MKLSQAEWDDYIVKSGLLRRSSYIQNLSNSTEGDSGTLTERACLNLKVLHYVEDI